MTNFFKPSVNVDNFSLLFSESARLRDFVSFSDDDGGSQFYHVRIRDNSAGGSSLRLGFNNLAAETWHSVTFNQFVNDLLILGAGGLSNNSFQIQVFDGVNWSNVSTFAVSTIFNNPNKPQISNIRAINSAVLESVAIADHFAVTDVDNSSARSFRFRDSRVGGGYFVLDGIRMAENQQFEIKVGQLRQLEYFTGDAPGTERLFVSANDGAAWSDVATINATATPNTAAPTVEGVNALVRIRSRVAVTEMFQFADADNNTLKRMRIRDMTGSVQSGFLLQDDTRLQAGAWHEVSQRDVFRLSFTGADRGFSDHLQYQVYDGQNWSEITNHSQITVNNRFAPEVEVRSFSVNEKAFRNLSSMFTFRDRDGDGPRLVQVRAYGEGLLAGHFFRDGVQMAGNRWHVIAQDDIGLWKFEAGKVGINTQVGIRASDGFSYSDNQVLDFRAVSSTPRIRAIDRTLAPLRSAGINSLFSYFDAEGQAIQQVRVRDSNTFGGSGSLFRGSVQQAAGIWHTFAIDQLDGWSVRTNENKRQDGIDIQVYDGFAWSNIDRAVITSFSTPPTVTTASVVEVPPLTVFQLSDMFNYSDVDGQPMQRVRVIEGNTDPLSGFLSRNGVRQDTLIWHEILTSELSEWTYTSGDFIGGDRVRFRVYDGYVWSEAAKLDVNSTTTRPIVEPIDRTVLPKTALALSSLFGYDDFDGDPMVSLRVRDENAALESGFLARNGVKQAAGIEFTILAGELNQWTFVAGDFLGSDDLRFSVNDGYLWSENEVGTITADTQVPSVIAFDFTVLPMTSVTVASLFQYSDPDGLPMQFVRVRDLNAAANSGFFLADGQRRNANTWFEIAVVDLGNWTFVSGAHLVNDDLEIRASNGYKFSASGIANVNSFSATPEVETRNRAIDHDDKTRLSYLFDYRDADGDSLQRIRIIDRNDDPTSGFLARNGGPVAAKVWHEILAADLVNWEFVGQTYLAQDTFSIQVYDGSTWSNESTSTVFWRNLFDPRLIDSSVAARQQPADSVDNAISYIFQPFPQGENFQVLGEHLVHNGVALDPTVVHTFTAAEFNGVRVVSGSPNANLLLPIDSLKVRVEIDGVWSQWSNVNIVNAPNIDNALDSLPGPEQRWLNNDLTDATVLTYAFTGSLPSYYAANSVERLHGQGFTAPNAKTRAQIRDILDIYSSMLNISFVEATGPFELSFGWMDMTDFPTSQYAYTNNYAAVIPDYEGGEPMTIDGDMWFNTFFSGGGNLSLTDPDPGEWGYSTYIREIGRALGLEYTNRGAFVMDETVNEAGDFVGVSHSYNSIMSREADYFNNPVTPMLYDIYELQRRYGANFGFATADNEYVFDDTRQVVRLIWDGGGQDTISFADTNLVSGGALTAQIDLRDGADSYIIDPSLTPLNRNYFRFGRYTIAFGTTIENAIGSDGDDMIIGNNFANNLRGGLGNDVLIGGSGDDSLDGGLGDDRYVIEFGHQAVVSFGHDSATIFEDNGGGTDRIEVYQAAEFQAIMGRGVIFERDFAFHRTGEDLTIELTLDNNAAEASISVLRMDLAASKIETLSFGEINVDLDFLFNQMTDQVRWTRFQLLTDSTANGLLVSAI